MPKIERIVQKFDRFKEPGRYRHFSNHEKEMRKSNGTKRMKHLITYSNFFKGKTTENPNYEQQEIKQENYGGPLCLRKLFGDARKKALEYINCFRGDQIQYALTNLNIACKHGISVDAVIEMEKRTNPSFQFIYNYLID